MTASPVARPGRPGERSLTGAAGRAGDAGHLTLRNVTKTFPPATTAVDDVDLDVAPGSFTVLLGLSGSGKSTLLRLVNGLHTPTSGTVTVLGTNVAAAGRPQLRELRRQTGMVFQQFHLVGSMSALENVCSGALGSLRGPRAGLPSYPRAVRERALEQLDRVGLADQRFQRADTLSAGSSSGSPLRGRSCSSPASCSPMSPWPRSTRSPRRR